MKVWKITFHDHDLGRIVIWENNETAATMRLRSLQRQQRERGLEPEGVERIERVDVPSTKHALVRWLNEQFD